MKQRVISVFVLLLMLLGMCQTAGAESASTLPIKVEIELSKSQLTGPEEITVTVRVTNVTDAAFTSPVSLEDPNGQLIDEFGTPLLEAGASASWTGTWAVTQAELDAGRITFRVRYPVTDENGIVSNARSSFAKLLTLVAAEPEVEVTRTIKPATASKNQEVSVIYEISNVGTVNITGVQIKESSAVSSKAASVGTIAAGAKATYVFTVKMGTKNLTSNATITYTAGTKSYTTKVENATIKYGKSNLTATLTADKNGGYIGDMVTLTLTLKNTGKKNMSGLTVTDDVLGTLFTDLSVDAGKTVTEKTTITVAQTADYQFTVSGKEGTADIETATGRINVIAMDPTNAPSLTIETEITSDVVYTLPSVVSITSTVTNNGAVDAKNVTVVSSGTTIASIGTLAAGKSATIKRDIEVQMTGQFRFDATYRNDIGENVTFEGDTIRISQAAPTEVPTAVPVATPKMFTQEELPTQDNLPAVVTQAQNALTILYYVFGALAIVAAALLIVSLVGRFVNRPKDGQEQYDLNMRRDYTQKVSDDDRVLISEDEKQDEAQDEKQDEAQHPVSTSDDTAESSEQSGTAQDILTADDMDDMQDAQTDNAQVYGRSRKRRE